MEPVAETPTLRALLARRDLRLRLDDADGIEPGALDRPVRWVHSSDLGDPTPFLSEGLVLLTTGTQFEDAGDAPDAYRAYVQPARRARRGRPRLRHRGGARRHPAGARRGVPRRADAAVRGAVPHAVHRRGARERRGDRRPGVRPPQLGARRAARDRPRRAPARTDSGRPSPSSRGSSTRGSGCSTPPASSSREHPVGGLDPDAAASLRAEVDAVLRRGARAGSALRIGDTPFTLQTLGRGGHLRGVIAIAAGDLDQEGRGVVTAVIAMAGLALEQHQGLSRARGALRAGLVQSLLTGDPALARRIARDLWGPLPPAPVLVAVTDAAAARVEGISELLELRVDERARHAVLRARRRRTRDRGPRGRPRGDRRGRRALRRAHRRLGSGVVRRRSPRRVDQARVARDRGAGAGHATSRPSRGRGCSRRCRARRGRSRPPSSRR